MAASRSCTTPFTGKSPSRWSRDKKISHPVQHLSRVPRHSYCPPPSKAPVTKGGRTRLLSASIVDGVGDSSFDRLGKLLLELLRDDGRVAIILGVSFVRALARLRACRMNLYFSVRWSNRSMWNHLKVRVPCPEELLRGA